MPAVAVMQQVTDTGSSGALPTGENNNGSQQKAEPATAFSPPVQRKEDKLQGGNEKSMIGIPAFQVAPPKHGTPNISQTVQRFEAAPKQNNTGMPDNLRSGIEQLSGLSMDDVKVNYNSSKPAQLNAHAYAQGTDIHLGPGQEQHLPHEAWHVVQQKQDRVKPTLQMKSNTVLPSRIVQRVGDEVKTMDGAPFQGDEEKHAEVSSVPALADTKRAGPMVAWAAPAGEEKKQEEEQEAGTKLALSASSKDEEVVKRRKAAAKDSLAIVRENKTSMGDYKSGFVKTMKKKMVDIVKDIQEKHGQMEQADNYINGDAGVNAFFSDEEKKADPGTESEAWDLKKDTSPAARHAKLAAVAGEILGKTYKTRLVKGNRLDAGALAAVTAESKLNITQSRERLEKTTADKAVVEMYYNELASLHEKNDKKNEGSSMIFDSAEEVEQRERSKAVFRDTAQDIFRYGFIRQQDTKARHTEQKAVRAKLETEGRITSTTRRAAEATGMAVLNALVKVVSLGILGVRKNRDKRGFVSGVDFSMDEATGRASKVKLKGRGKGGKFEITNIYNDYVFARDELKAKWKKRAPMGKYAGSALVLDGFRKFIDAIQSIFSSLSLALTGIGLIPGVAPVVAPVIAFCSSVVLAIGLAKAALSVLITLINAVAQIENTNPELFAEMSGETAKAGINAITDGVGIGVGAAIASSGARKLGAGTSFEDKITFNNPAFEKGYGMIGDTGNWFAKQGISAGAAIATNVVPKVTNAAVTASGNLDNNDMTYSQTINESRRIGKSRHEAKSDLVDNNEKKHIQNAAKTTKEKADKGASQLRIALVKFVAPPAAPAHPGIREDKKQAGNQVVEIGNEVKQQSGDTVELLDGLGEKK